MDRKALEALIAESVRAYCLAMRSAEVPIGPDTPLFGLGGALDSIGLVSVIVEVEQKLSDLEGREISLMNDRAMSQTRSPFRTIRALADYAEAQSADAGPL